MDKKIEQNWIMQEAKLELLRGNRVTISPKRFGHSRKFDGECDIVTSSKPLRNPLREVKRDAKENTTSNDPVEPNVTEYHSS